MVDTTLPGVLLKGVAASRPAANAVAKGTIYSATDTGAITQSDGSSWSTYATISSGLADPMTTRGDIIIRNASNTTARLGIGSSGKVLSSDGTDISWQTPAGGGADATHPLPLDSYAIDGTYGDDFTGASLSGSWTRRNYGSGAESYQVGPKATHIRIAGASRAAGDGYFRTAPGGDWTFGMAFSTLSPAMAGHWGLMVVDSAGTGVGCAIYHANPSGPLLQSVTTYTSTSGTFYMPTQGSSGSPSSPLLTNNEPMEWAQRKVWLYLRKNGTNYYISFSLNGETWMPEGGPLAWAGTVDRVAMGNVALASTSIGTGEVYDVDWFNKIA